MSGWISPSPDTTTSISSSAQPAGSKICKDCPSIVTRAASALTADLAGTDLQLEFDIAGGDVTSAMRVEISEQTDRGSQQCP